MGAVGKSLKLSLLRVHLCLYVQLGVALPVCGSLEKAGGNLAQQVQVKRRPMLAGESGSVGVPAPQVTPQVVQLVTGSSQYTLKSDGRCLLWSQHWSSAAGMRYPMPLGKVSGGRPDPVSLPWEPHS